MEVNKKIEFGDLPHAPHTLPIPGKIQGQIDLKTFNFRTEREEIFIEIFLMRANKFDTILAVTHFINEYWGIAGEICDFIQKKREEMEK